MGSLKKEVRRKVDKLSKSIDKDESINERMK